MRIAFPITTLSRHYTILDIEAQRKTYKTKQNTGAETTGKNTLRVIHIIISSIFKTKYKKYICNILTKTQCT